MDEVDKKQLEIFNRNEFAELIGSNFQLPAPNDEVLELELAEVSELRKRRGQESFSVIFLLQEGYTAAQGLYDMSHEKLGAMQLFLVPVGVENGRIQLEAVFSSLVKGS
jgi:hypothetical protein